MADNRFSSLPQMGSPTLQPDVLQGQLDKNFGAGLLGPFAMRQTAPKDVPAPKPFMERIWQNYASKMKPQEFIHSEALWGGARQVAEQTGGKVSEQSAFAQIANHMFERMGVKFRFTEQSANEFMGKTRADYMLKDLLQNK